MPAPVIPEPKAQLINTINMVATSVGHPRTNDPVGTTDEAILRMVYQANAACIDLMTMADWQVLSNTATISIFSDTPGQVEKAFDLPADFFAMVDDSHWNRSTQLPALGPVNSQDWQWLIVRQAKVTIRFMWRLRDGKLWIKSPPDSPQDLTFEYIQKNWAIDGQNGFGKSYMDKNEDYHLFPWQLVVYFTRAKWLESEGYDAGEAQKDFKRAFDYFTGTDKGATALSLVPGVGFPYLDAIRNLPDTGYGTP